MLDYDKVPLGVASYNCEWEPLSSKEKLYGKGTYYNVREF